ncbi:MAG: hypothetical protein HFF89_02575 [Oscillibacter sp.]|jgi:hypothetical protein|nr:hypothetical protein [Oscillibacter sp.]MCI8689838.1 hypothetical protein [Oscillibacter sp.]MCI9482750.1 hypothetical protein [Oscillibacter sp.]
MYFLIDFENVKNAGMQGTEYLENSDHVIIFYSAAVPNMEARYLEEIKASGCTFEVCKLIKPHKNALDFYIATRLGEIYGNGYNGSLAIISRDDGFHALRDYWASCAAVQHQVLICDSIERSIISANKPNQRTALIHARLKSTDIGNFYSAYAESIHLRRQLDEAFAGTAFSARTGEIEELLKNGKTPKIIYLDALRRFGRRDGLTVYNTLKSCAEF